MRRLPCRKVTGSHPLFFSMSAEGLHKPTELALRLGARCKAIHRQSRKLVRSGRALQSWMGPSGLSATSVIVAPRPDLASMASFHTLAIAFSVSWISPSRLSANNTFWERRTSTNNRADKKSAVSALFRLFARRELLSLLSTRNAEARVAWSSRLGVV